MFIKDFVVSICTKDGICREFKDSLGGQAVYLKYGSEYSIYLKNLRDVRACVKVTVDGTETTADGLVIGANASHTLEGVIGADNVTHNVFKFIAKTRKIKEFRGDKADDSVIQVSVTFEKKPVVRRPSLLEEYPWIHDQWYSRPVKALNNYSLGNAQQMGFHCNTRSCSNEAVSTSNISPASLDMGGITVPGTPTDVRYSTTTFNASDDTTSVSFRLSGVNPEDQIIQNPVVTSRKRQCPTCGTHNPNTNKYCGECSRCLV